jgi:hypothetical protein
MIKMAFIKKKIPSKTVNTIRHFQMIALCNFMKRLLMKENATI